MVGAFLTIVTEGRNTIEMTIQGADEMGSFPSQETVER